MHNTFPYNLNQEETNKLKHNKYRETNISTKGRKQNKIDNPDKTPRFT